MNPLDPVSSTGSQPTRKKRKPVSPATRYAKNALKETTQARNWARGQSLDPIKAAAIDPGVIQAVEEAVQMGKMEAIAVIMKGLSSGEMGALFQEFEFPKESQQKILASLIAEGNKAALEAGAGHIAKFFDQADRATNLFNERKQGLWDRYERIKNDLKEYQREESNKGNQAAVKKIKQERRNLDKVHDKALEDNADRYEREIKNLIAGVRSESDPFGFSLLNYVEFYGKGFLKKFLA